MSQPSVVLISGWAMPAMAMETLATALDADHRRVSVVQLPGLVEEPSSGYDWEELLAYLDLHLFEKPVVLVGWSLGGMLASLYASRYPENVAGVVTLATNACFVKRSEWPEAMEPAMFAGFQAGMSESSELTLQQFAMLCSAGSNDRKGRTRELQALLTDTDQEAVVLQSLLKLLGESDFRSVLADIRCPVIHVLGKNDALVPDGAAQQLAETYPRHRVHLVDGGHCFFMEDASMVVREIQYLCNQG
ncbi:hypothetical protein ACH42_08510 [Endozoicomonas sp. (ex Bugula neritina AB1)]|nr:hypothetical protein ACH42_08510 [Endozoicomonas sp. (ex Bugula neritina AB1)]